MRSPTVAIMSDVDHTETLRAAERRVQAAQLASDVDALTELLHDALLFTGPDGNLYLKEDDLAAHRSGRQVLSRVEESELRVLVTGSTGLSGFSGHWRAASVASHSWLGCATPGRGLTRQARAGGSWRHTRCS